MPETFEETPLWCRTLGARCDDGDQARAAMAAAFHQFRRVVKDLAGEIGRTMPLFTDHSIEHADSLWDMASLLCGADFPINPAEAFVLGGAFLLHDLGMALAVLPDGLGSLERDRLFPALLAEARARQGADDPAEQAVRDEALAELVRLRHAENAERLAFEVFRTPDGQPFHLLQDAALRQNFGALIGKIAASHGWDVARLAGLDQRLGSCVDHPPHWEVDPLKIACVLRLADVAHIDQRRAPIYLHSYRQPTGESHRHWYFQGRLTRPRVEGDRLVYTAMDSFRRDEANAWWLAQETIRTIDEELRRVDALCADLGRPRFPVRAVAGADSPQRLARYIPAQGWEPIDAQLRVTDTVGLVANLGGEDLYGRKPEVALRELIANAVDASQARRLVEGGSAAAVQVELREEAGSWWLTVTDQGIGMSREAMVAALTDFGRSRWHARDLVEDVPELSGQGFRPVGRFGIGFFAVFMVADEVQVRSLAYGAALATTHILEFPAGVSVRPILRLADPAERLRTWGTSVRLKLRLDPRSLDGMFRTDQRGRTHTQLLHSRVARLCALSEVDIAVRGPDDIAPIILINGGDWTTIPADELFRRVYPRDDFGRLTRMMIDGYEQLFTERAATVEDASGAVIGRAMIATGWERVYPDMYWFQPPPQGHVYVGGFHADELDYCLGVFVGEPLTADRLRSFPAYDLAEWHRWLEEQADAITTDPGAHIYEQDLAGDLVRAYDAGGWSLPCAGMAHGLADRSALVSWLTGKDEIFLVSGNAMSSLPDATGGQQYFSHDGRVVEFPDNTLLISLNPMWLFPEQIMPRPRDERFADAVETDGGWDVRSWWYDTGNFGTPGLVVRTVAEVWGIDVVEAVGCMEALHVSEGRDRRPILPTRDGPGVRATAIRMRRPGGGTEA
ncbi:HD domain-containing protein [Symbioplanes lichenis]|uniref:HD domain-containing protein n=1 Tax=Symbioplanes lichenis TaxID=1629072 RepID=UPI002738322D|nr:ATP-binding protein [Actinoplanes lichenis]